MSKLVVSETHLCCGDGLRISVSWPGVAETDVSYIQDLGQLSSVGAKVGRDRIR